MRHRELQQRRVLLLMLAAAIAAAVVIGSVLALLSMMLWTRNLDVESDGDTIIRLQRGSHTVGADAVDAGDSDG